MDIQLRVLPEQAVDSIKMESAIADFLKQNRGSFFWKWKKRSIDARKSTIWINATVEIQQDPFEEIDYQLQLNPVSDKIPIHIIGAGPAGIYAALQAIELGFKPILFERGKDVRNRRRDLAAINKTQMVNAESNYCFGEGGAGTYSDGKLYTRSKKRGDVRKAMEWLVGFGAPTDILVDAHPHIGTNKLPNIIVAMRNYIINCGGEVHFESKLTDFSIVDNRIIDITINDIQTYKVNSVVLATGHSARDIFYLLHRKNVTIKAKSFALGVRVEHKQELIDKIQYHGQLSGDLLPPAAYALVTQVDGKGVFSFCMCPGGIIAPCATNQSEVVTNGWSPSKRNNSTSNSGIVVTIDPEDTNDVNDPLTCLRFQEEVEHSCWEAAGSTQRVPAQRLTDFVARKKSIDFPRTSYQPGIVSVELNKVLPSFVADRLRKGFIDFGKKMNGFLTEDAVVHAPESRTSSPVSIPRNPETCEHIEVAGLYPCGEGAGFAGGIISAAIDGMKCVQAIAKKYEKTITL